MPHSAKNAPRSWMRVAAAQIEPKPYDVHGNLEKHLEWIDKARAEQVDLLVFPELSLTGYNVGPRAPDVAMHIEDPALQLLAEAAGDMSIVVGFVEEGFAAQFYCAAAYLAAGKPAFVHRKLNLANYGAMEEGKYFASGRYVEPFPVRDPFTAVMLLCADTWNPALVHLAALHGATMLIVPTNSSLDAKTQDFSKPQTWDVVLSFYSAIYGIPIIFANRIGTEGDHEFWGGSRIMGPQGAPLAEASSDGEQLVIAEVSYQEVRTARFKLPTVRDSNLGLFQREVNRLVKRLGVPNRIRDDH